MNAYGVKSGWSCWWQVKTVIPLNTCHSVALRDCLGRKNHTLLYFYLVLIVVAEVLVDILVCHLLLLSAH